MASPHIVALSKVGWGSVTRTVSNLSISPAQIDVYDDTGAYPQGGLQPPVAGGGIMQVSFTTELNPSGSSGGAKTPPDDALLVACMLDKAISTTVSTTYTFAQDPADLSAVTLSVAVGNAIKFVSTASAGNVTFRFASGRPVLCEYSFLGQYAAPTEAALTDTLTNGGAAPICAGGTMTLNSDALKFREITISTGNAISPRGNMAVASGYDAPVVARQVPMVSILAEVPDYSTENYYTDLTAGTLLPFSIAIGSGAGYVITTTGKMYLTATPEMTESAGIACFRLSGRMDGAAGSPIAIAFT